MALTDMAVTEAEKKARERKYTARMDGDTGPDYPYGLSVHLDEGSLVKLKVKDLPKAGDLVEIRGTGKVRRVSQEDVDGGQQERSVELQITHLEPFATDEKEDAAAKLYDNAGARKAAAPRPGDTGSAGPAPKATVTRHAPGPGVQ